jgi:K+-transporting ATPase ATPase C chain
MKELAAEIRTAVCATAVLAVVCGGLYPLAVWGIAQAVYPERANGSLIADPNGTIRGSRLIGQRFASPQEFHSRPSAAGDGYDAANSGGSNLGPTSGKLRDVVRARVAAYRAENGLAQSEPVPADAVTASGSGLDPHISVRNAELQARRVAKARGLSEGTVRELIRTSTDLATFGILGESRVDVGELNRALEAEVQSSKFKVRNRGDVGGS